MEQLAIILFVLFAGALAAGVIKVMRMWADASARTAGASTRVKAHPVSSAKGYPYIA